MKSSLHKIIALIIMLDAGHVFAANVIAPSSAYNYDRLYIGADIGLASLTDKSLTNNPILDTQHLSAAGFMGGGLIGYDYTLRNQFKLGLEGFINTTDLKIISKQNYTPQSAFQVQMNYATGFRLLPGYEFTPGTVTYVIAGYANSRFKIMDNGDFGLINTQFSKSGFQGGFGIKTHLYENVSIRADTIYTTYVNQASNGVTTTTPASTQIYKSNFATLEENLSLIYKFS